MVEPSTSNVNEATAQDTDEDQSKSIMEVEESNEAIEKSSVPTSSSAEPAITTASNVSKVRKHTEVMSDFCGSFFTPLKSDIIPKETFRTAYQRIGKYFSHLN